MVEDLVRQWLAMPQERRNEALLSRMLRTVGKRDVGELVDAYETAGFGGRMPAETRDAMETALVEAIARLDEPSTLPMLRTAFTDGRSADVRAVAARGIARACADQDLARLLDHAREGDRLLPASVEGLGRCLRRESAERLASLLDARPDAANVAGALGRLGSALVWSAPVRRDDPEGEAIRLVAARSLARATVTADAPEARRALDVVRHPMEPALLEEARQIRDRTGGTP